MNVHPPLNGESTLRLNDLDYFETRGLNVLVFSNWYNSNFSDSKISGVEIIHHGLRTATNGDVRLGPTPEQWDPIPTLKERRVNNQDNSIEAISTYPDDDFDFVIKAKAHGNGVLLSVHLEEPLPEALVGRAGFNLEFLPAAYFEKAYLMDGKSGVFPLYPAGPTAVDASGAVKPHPIATGKRLVLAPEDPAARVTIEARDGELSLFDGRNKAQNGWYVVRSLIPEGRSGMVVEWFLTANTIPDWTRTPVIAHSQVGYHPRQAKVAVIELDRNDTPRATARLLRISHDGKVEEKSRAGLKEWGKYLRYIYYLFDFTSVTASGLYVIEYGQTRTKPFRISNDVLDNTWQPTLDVFFPVQMDHMLVNEAYRVWHGAAHLDDALQAPVDHVHFDLYAQGPTTDTPYGPGEHIPGLNIGGWFDAGDYDIRTQSQVAVVRSMVDAWETFGLDRDETTVDQERRTVDLHHPDSKPDLLQQIEHGALALIAQHRAVGHAIPGIIVPNLSQYKRLGDALTMTDNVVTPDPEVVTRTSDGFANSPVDDRWAFTSRSTPLNYGSAAALAAASRALRNFNDALANECLETAQKVWDEEHSHEPHLFSHGNTTGGRLKEEELKAAVELVICTQDARYAERIVGLWPTIEERFSGNAALAVRAMPYMDVSYAARLRSLVEAYKGELKAFDENPFGVPISRGGWAGNGLVIRWATTNYFLHKAFPDLIDPEYTLRGLNYVYGCHPGSDISFVSGVGTVSKKVAYGTNRADFSFIAGGIVPGALIIAPDFPENKEDWPYLWGENEYVIGICANYLFLVHAAKDLLSGAD